MKNTIKLRKKPNLTIIKNHLKKFFWNFYQRKVCGRFLEGVTGTELEENWIEGFLKGENHVISIVKRINSLDNGSAFLYFKVPNYVCNLESISFYKCNISSKMLHKVNFGRLWRLKKVDLSNNQIISLWEISKLENCGELILHNNLIRSILPLSRMKKLKKLDISENRISSLFGLERIVQLVKLNISENKFSISHLNNQTLSRLLKKKVNIECEKCNFFKIRELKTNSHEVFTEHALMSDSSNHCLGMNQFLDFHNKLSLEYIKYKANDYMDYNKDTAFEENDYNEKDKFNTEFIIIDPIRFNENSFLKDLLRKYRKKYSNSFEKWHNACMKENGVMMKKNDDDLKTICDDIRKDIFEKMGREKNKEEGERIVKDISSTLKSHKIPLNEFIEKGCGMCRHRCLLFKYVCDMSGIPCRVVGGEGHMWCIVVPNGICEYRVELMEKKNLFEIEKETRDNEKKFKFNMLLEGVGIGGGSIHTYVDNSGIVKRIKEEIIKNRGLKSCVKFVDLNKEVTLENNRKIKQVALKIVPISKQSQYYTNNEEYIYKKLHRLRLDLSPTYFPEWLGSFKKSGYFFHVLEKFDMNGKEFIKRIDKYLDKNLKLLEVIKFLRGVLGSIIFLSANGIVHCDLKLENVLVELDEEGILKKVVVCDFGGSLVNDNVKNGMISFTSVNSSPEVKECVVNNKVRITKKADVFSFGKIIENLIKKKLFEETITISSIMENLKKRCLKEDAKNRVKMSDLKLQINIILASFPIDMYKNENKVFTKYLNLRNEFIKIDGVSKVHLLDESALFLMKTKKTLGKKMDSVTNFWKAHIERVTVKRKNRKVKKKKGKKWKDSMEMIVDVFKSL